MKPDASMISGAMAAESALAKKEANELESAIDSLPEDHPLKAQAARQRQLMGDLAGLPPGHPLLVAMEEARLRYEDSSHEADEVETAEKVKIKRAKKLDERKARVEQRRREDEREERLRTATKRINSSMNETIDVLKRLKDNVAASHEDFQGDRYATMKLERLDRLVTATMRGINELKLNAGRVVSDG